MLPVRAAGPVVEIGIVVGAGRRTQIAVVEGLRLDDVTAGIQHLGGLRLCLVGLAGIERAGEGDGVRHGKERGGRSTRLPLLLFRFAPIGVSGLALVLKKDLVGGLRDPLVGIRGQMLQ